MYVVTICSLIALLLTYLESNGQLKNGMKLGFILVTFLGCVHYDFGNDYMSYYGVYQNAISYTFDYNYIMLGEVFRDPGWILLCWAFKPIGGFFMMVAVLNILQNWLIYRFIKREVNVVNHPFAVFIYLFSTSLYLMSFSMMRQMLVAVIFLGLWHYISNRKWWMPLFVLYLCSFIHSSAIVLLPFAFWGFVPIKNGKFLGLIYILILSVLWFSPNLLNQLFLSAVESRDEFGNYLSVYGNGKSQGLSLGLGFAIQLIPVVLSILYLLNSEKKSYLDKKKLVALAMISALITPFGAIIPIVTRISTYFNIYTIASYPLVYTALSNRPIRMLCLSLCVLIILYNYFIFFNNEVWSEKFSEFHTIFSVL